MKNTRDVHVCCDFKEIISSCSKYNSHLPFIDIIIDATMGFKMMSDVMGFLPTTTSILQNKISTNPILPSYGSPFSISSFLSSSRTQVPPTKAL